MARLLVPGDFGQMDVALHVVGLIYLLTERRFVKGMTQRMADDTPYLERVFTVRLPTSVTTVVGLFSTCIHRLWSNHMEEES
jgi:hypothetical protein